MTQLTVESIQFPHESPARLVRVARDIAAGALVEALELPPPRAVLVLNGGTAELESDTQAQLAGVLGDGLARCVAEERITTVTGGTDAGIFALFGQGLERWGRTAPCVGVTVGGLVTLPGHPKPETPALEPHHSHFVFTTGRHWGDETKIMYELIAALARQCRALVLFAGGGQIATQEMVTASARGHELILLAGSGRATDAVLAARDGRPSDDPRINQVAQSGNITRFQIGDDPAALRALVRRKLLD